ncbi:MAG: succinate dehydrogenase cytochrome b subunit [Myxococcota bacterium]|nr:succinate dehydrogenase cytochrome b subunit [Myxococcota bacterium]
MTTAVLGFYRTVIGKKVVMAATGAIVVGFVLAHMVGNLQIFLGPEKINGYAQFLKSLGGGLWLFRGVILISAVWHIIAATQVTLTSLAARPKRYRVQRYVETTYAARTMRWGGPILGLFVLYHLFHLTWGTVHPAGPAFDATDVYNNVVTGFQVAWVAGVYIVANLFLGLHLLHGVWSAFQTVGANHPKWNQWRGGVAAIIAAVITLGNISIPTAVLIGYLQPC